MIFLHEKSWKSHRLSLPSLCVNQVVAEIPFFCVCFNKKVK